MYFSCGFIVFLFVECSIEQVKFLSENTLVSGVEFICFVPYSLRNARKIRSSFKKMFIGVFVL